MSSGETDQLQVLLAGCRLDLAAMRHDLARSTSTWGPTRVGRRESQLDQVADRLEQATALLERIVRGASGATADGRLGNSLDTLSAFLSMRAKWIGSGEVRDGWPEAGVEPGAAAQAHEAVWMTEPHDLPHHVEVRALVGAICDGFRRKMPPGPGGPVLRAYLTRLDVPAELARQLGLVVTELIANALRHAFRHGRAGRIWVVGYPLDGGRYVLSVEDDGRGLPPGFDLRLRPEGSGLRMVNMLVDQARIRMTCHGDNGAWFVLTVPARRVG